MTEDVHTPTEEEDFFTSYYLEVERILEYDESKMDPKVFARKRVLNLQKAFFEIEEHNQGKKMRTVALEKGSLGRKKSGSIRQNIDQSDEYWHPEYCVCYVVQWKGMQAPEVTWEYWKDIKKDYMTQYKNFGRDSALPHMKR